MLTPRRPALSAAAAPALLELTLESPCAATGADSAVRLRSQPVALLVSPHLVRELVAFADLQHPAARDAVTALPEHASEQAAAARSVMR